MCDFVSTIEKRDDDTIFVAFLQNSDLETEAGKKLLAYLGTHTEDFCGHGVIVKYYELSGWTLPKWYAQKEYTNFSNPSTFPDTIVEAIKAGNLSLIGKPGNISQLLNKRGVDRIKADAEWNKADAEWNKADAEWNKTYAEWKKADAEWNKTYAERNKTYAEWKKADAERKKADAEWKKADAERKKADAERKKADAAAFWKVFAHPSYRRKCWR